MWVNYIVSVFTVNLQKNICDVVAKFLLGVMILNMIQIVQAAFANVLHTSTTIRKPLPPKLKKFLAFLFFPRKEEKDDRKPQRNGGQKNVILTEQGNAIANLNANDKEGIETEGSKNADGKQAGETDKMLDGGGGEERPDYTEDWKRFFLCLDKLFFIILVVIITFVFFYMVYY